jgi:hypothetical protein
VIKILIILKVKISYHAERRKNKFARIREDE